MDNERRTRGLTIRSAVPGAAGHGLTGEWPAAVFLRAATCCGVPAAIDSFRVAREVLEEQGL